MDPNTPPPNHLMSSPGYVMPQSPVDMKPDASLLLSPLSVPPPSSNYSLNDSSSGYPPPMMHPHGPHGQQQVRSAGSSPPTSSSNSSYPPNHPLSGSKHFCSICGDRASGKHYGVYSCEGCKGFFKRTVRKELTYACRENRDCVIDKRQRNRCQYCRYMKCLDTGMKREAVQEERHRGGGGGGGVGGGGSASNGHANNNNNNNNANTANANHSSTLVLNNNNNSNSAVSAGSTNPMVTSVLRDEVESSTSGDMPIERIIEAEDVSEMKQDNSEFLMMENGEHMELQRFRLAEKRIIHQLIEWAKLVPHFSELKVEDQVTLIRGGWNELLVAGLAFRSLKINDGILLGNGTVVTRENAHEAGVGHIFDRVLVELIAKMKEMQMHKAELGCLRAIILFNPDAKGLCDVNKVESLREKVYATLEEYTRSVHKNEPSRFAKLLLRLPALRSIGLKCLEHLFFYKLVGDYLNEGNPLEKFIQSLLEECC